MNKDMMDWQDEDTPHEDDAPDLARMDAVDWLNHTARQDSRTSVLSSDDEYALAMRAWNGDATARDELVLHNIRLAFDVARKYMGRGLPLEDLRQEAMFGLMRAAEKFDPTLGYKFSTYATWWLRQSVDRACQDRARMIRLPVHAAVKHAQVTKAQLALMLELGREPTDAEIAAALDLEVPMNATQVRALLEQGKPTLSLDEPAYGDEGAETLLDLIEDGAAAPAEAAVEQLETRADVHAAVAKLPERQQVILRLRFGLDDEDGIAKSLEQVGQRLGITRERVRQIEAEALYALRFLMAGKTPPRRTYKGMSPEQIRRKREADNERRKQRRAEDAEFAAKRREYERKTEARRRAARAQEQQRQRAS